MTSALGQKRTSGARYSMSALGQQQTSSTPFAIFTLNKSSGLIPFPSRHGVSNPFAFKACLTAGEVKNAISAFAASTCLLAELIPATYTE
jgi:hypothetical protein